MRLKNTRLSMLLWMAATSFIMAILISALRSVRRAGWSCILRDADQLSIAGIEKKIAEFGQKAKDGKLRLEELSGGTFSISNGGVFGSMLSTPIINPPQPAILGVHATKERAVVENGHIVIRPMNYLALSYDHRLIDE